MKIFTMRGDLDLKLSSGRIVRLKPGNPPTPEQKKRGDVGGYNYPKVDPSDPKVAEQLKMYRKHGAVSFAELLPCDADAMKKANATTADERIEAVRQANAMRPSPVGRDVTIKKDGKGKRGESPRRKASVEAAKKGGTGGHLGGPAENDRPSGGSRKKKD